MRGTIEAIERDLLRDGLVLRYRTRDDGVDGLPAGEGVFLPCSFWLVDCYELLGRHDEAHALFERLLGLANDVGLLAEEYDPQAKRLLGNFPQAFTHLALVNYGVQRAAASAVADAPAPRASWIAPAALIEGEVAQPLREVAEELAAPGSISSDSSPTSFS